MDNNNLTLEEKVDLLLKYQQRAHRLQMIRLGIGLVLFIVLVVLPIIFTIMWFQSLDLSGITGTYENVKGMSDGATGSIDRLNELLKDF